MLTPPLCNLIQSPVTMCFVHSGFNMTFVPTLPLTPDVSMSLREIAANDYGTNSFNSLIRKPVSQSLSFVMRSFQLIILDRIVQVPSPCACSHLSVLFRDENCTVRLLLRFWLEKLFQTPGFGQKRDMAYRAAMLDAILFLWQGARSFVNISRLNSVNIFSFQRDADYLVP